MSQLRDDASNRFTAIGVKPKEASELAEPGRVRMAFCAGWDAREELAYKLLTAADTFVEVTQERSKMAGHNRMLAPDEYVKLLEAIVEYRRSLL